MPIVSGVLFAHFIFSHALHSESFGEVGHGIRLLVDQKNGLLDSPVRHAAASRKDAHGHRTLDSSRQPRPGRRETNPEHVGSSLGERANVRRVKRGSRRVKKRNKPDLTLPKDMHQALTTRKDVKALMKKEAEITELKTRAETLRSDVEGWMAEAKKQQEKAQESSLTDESKEGKAWQKEQDKEADALADRISNANTEVIRLEEKAARVAGSVRIEAKETHGHITENTTSKDKSAGSILEFMMEDKTSLKGRLRAWRRKLRLAEKKAIKKEARIKQEMTMLQQQELWEHIRDSQETRLRLDDRLDKLKLIIQTLLEKAMKLRQESRETVKKAKHPKDGADAKRLLKKLNVDLKEAAFVSTKVKSLSTLEVDLKRRIGRLKERLRLYDGALQQTNLTKAKLWFRISNADFASLSQDTTGKAGLESQVKQVVSSSGGHGLKAEDVKVVPKSGLRKSLILDVEISKPGVTGEKMHKVMTNIARSSDWVCRNLDKKLPAILKGKSKAVVDYVSTDEKGKRGANDRRGAIGHVLPRRTRPEELPGSALPKPSPGKDKKMKAAIKAGGTEKRAKAADKIGKASEAIKVAEKAGADKKVEKAAKAGKGKNPAKKAAKEPAKKAARRNGNDPAKKAAKEPAKKAAKRKGKDPAKKAAKEPAKKAAKRKGKDPAKKAAKKPAKKAAKRKGKDPAKKAVKEPAKKAAKRKGKDPAKKAAKEPAKKAAKRNKPRPAMARNKPRPATARKKPRPVAERRRNKPRPVAERRRNKPRPATARRVNTPPGATIERRVNTPPGATIERHMKTRETVHNAESGMPEDQLARPWAARDGERNEMGGPIVNPSYVLSRRKRRRWPFVSEMQTAAVAKAGRGKGGNRATPENSVE